MVLGTSHPTQTGLPQCTFDDDTAIAAQAAYTITLQVPNPFILEVRALQSEGHEHACIPEGQQQDRAALLK